MAGKKKAGIVLLVLGIVILILSIIADLIGIGASPSFGYRQIIGVIIGILAGVLGLLLMRRTRSS